MAPLPFFTRVWLAWVCFFRVLFDGEAAARTRAALDGETPERLPAPRAEPPPPARPPAPKADAALQLLALLQREGRFVDFLEEDVASFADADIGAAARVVHAGCRKAVREHVKLAPVRTESEGTSVTLAEGFDPAEIKLTGNVQGKGPHSGKLVHRGWRAVEVTLPTRIDGDARVLAQAEVEL